MKSNWLLPATALVTHNALSDEVPFPKAPTTDDDTAGTAREICQILVKQKVNARLFPLADLKDLVKLKTARADFIFNCADDHIGQYPSSSHLVPQIARLKKIPYTGGSAANILLTNNKVVTKKFCLKNSILTPDFWVVSKLNQLKKLAVDRADFFPVIIKPVNADGSEGITQKSVVTSLNQLTYQVKRVLDVFCQPALIEKYIVGREISQSILETRNSPELFPLAEIIFTKKFKPRYKIVDFHSKWRPQTNQYQETKRSCPAKLPAKLARKIKQISTKIWHCFNLQGYARIDYRVDKQNQTFLLEVNINPDITNDDSTGFTAAAKIAGHSYQNLVLHLVDTAMFKYHCV